LRNEEHVKQAVTDLWNDEQIDAAIQVGIFSYAFCFNNNHTNTRSIEQMEYFSQPHIPFLSNPPEAPFTYKIPDRRIFEIGEICAIGCEERCHGDDCYRLHANQAIESVMLNQLITIANTMAASAAIGSITAIPYVLDIDLDYFRSISSLRPTKPRKLATPVSFGRF
jgi:hypothetical protein